jgi:aspartyl-tRNA(Asn)/glutamyl-tRNA(Gln) amidotransferase subunit B
VKYETVIGLEVHAELSTKSKIFCGCSTEFGAPPNSNTCPVCLGHPGVLPVLNQEALRFAIKAALALNCEVGEYTRFDRKNYFYPDLPKAYQISQYDHPIGKRGWIEIEVNGERKRIGINRLHLEEDAGKLTHREGGKGTLVDFNRVGVPLIEIVSEPDLRSPEEARLYLEKLKAILQYTEVSDVKMEEGSLRCDANISIRPIGQKEFGTKTELKNMNTFSGVQRGLEYEEKRQAELLDSGQQVVQETRRWDEARRETVVMRSKEEAHDYRYFPDPDLVEIKITPEMIMEIKATIPELPDARRERYLSQYGLPAYDAEVITMSKKMADFFEETLSYGVEPKTVANWLMGELLGYLNKNSLELDQVSLTPRHLGKMIQLLEQGTISGKIAKTIFAEMLETGKEPEAIVAEKGLVQITDVAAITAMINNVLAAHPQSVEDYRNGKSQALGYLVGQVMKESKGKANPQLVNKILLDLLIGGSRNIDQ